MAKILNMIKRAVVTNPGKDDGEFPGTQVSYLGKTSDIETIFPYGMAANSPRDSIVLMFNILSQEENKAGIAYRHDLRPKNLKEGEVVFGNFLAGSTVKYDKDGNAIEIIKGNKTITIDGDLSVTVTNVNINASGDYNITANGNYNLTATEANITANVKITGTFEVTEAATFGSSISSVGSASFAGKDYISHTHPINGGSSAPGPTGGVT